MNTAHLTTTGLPPPASQSLAIAAGNGQGRWLVQFALLILATVLLASCGGGSSSNRCEARPCVLSGFDGDLDWHTSTQDGGVGGGADGGGGVGGGGGLGIVRNAEIVVTFADGTTRSALTDRLRGMVTIVPVEGYTGPVYLEIRGRAGADYFDEGRNAFLPFPEGRVLRAFVPRLGSNVGITAFTEAAYQLSVLCQQGAGPVDVCSSVAPQPGERAGSASFPSPSAGLAANRHVANVLSQQLPDALKIDEISRLPFVVSNDTGQDAIANTPRGRYGLANAALSKQAAMYNPVVDAPTLHAIDQLSRDLQDGRLDGVGGDGTPANLRTYDPHTLVSELGTALAQQAARYGNSDTRNLLPALTAFANTRYDSYYFDATLKPDGTSSTIAIATESQNRTRTAGQQTVYAGPNSADARGFMLYGNMGSGALFIKTDTPDSRGRLLAVGDNRNGELGDGTQAGSRPGQANVPSIPATLTHVAGGIAHTVARFADGSVFAWGDNSLGQLGQGQNGTTLPGSTQPLAVPLPRLALSVAAASQSSFALLDDGSVWSWGSGFGFGTLGDNTADGLRISPAPVMGSDGPLTGIVQLSARDNDVIALGADGAVWTWGSFPAIATAERATGITAGRTIATRMEGIPRTTGGPRKVLTEQGLFAVLLSGKTADGQDLDGAVYAWGIHFDITAGEILADTVPQRVLNLPPVRDLMPGGFLGYGQRPADRMTGMAVDYDGGFWKVRGRVAEHYDPANPTAQRRPQGMAPRTDCASCHVIRPRTVPPVPTTGTVCSIPSGILALLTSQSTCQSCHNSSPLASGRVLGALNCVPPALPAPKPPTEPVVYPNRCLIPTTHPVIRATSACSSCHNSIVAAPLQCAFDQIGDPASTTLVTITGATDDFPPTVGAVANGGATNDTTPTLAGSLSAPLAAGEYVTVLRDGTPIGQASATGTTWTFTTPALPVGQTYRFTARVDRAGAEAGVSSAAYVLSIATGGPNRVISIATVNNQPAGASIVVADATPTLGGVIQTGGTASALGTGETIELQRTGPAAEVVLLTTNIAINGSDWSFTDMGLPDGSYLYQARAKGATGDVGAFGNAVSVIVDTSTPSTGPAVVVITDRPAGVGSGIRASGLGLSDATIRLASTSGAPYPAGTMIEYWLTTTQNPAGRSLGQRDATATGTAAELPVALSAAEGASHVSENETPPDGLSSALTFTARLINRAGTVGGFGAASRHDIGLFSCADLFVVRRQTVAEHTKDNTKTAVEAGCGNGCHQSVPANPNLQGLPGSATTTSWCTHGGNSVTLPRPSSPAVLAGPQGSR